MILLVNLFDQVKCKPYIINEMECTQRECKYAIQLSHFILIKDFKVNLGCQILTLCDK